MLPDRSGRGCRAPIHRSEVAAPAGGPPRADPPRPAHPRRAGRTRSDRNGRRRHGVRGARSTIHRADQPARAGSRRARHSPDGADAGRGSARSTPRNAAVPRPVGGPAGRSAQPAPEAAARTRTRPRRRQPGPCSGTVAPDARGSVVLGLSYRTANGTPRLVTRRSQDQRAASSPIAQASRRRADAILYAVFPGDSPAASAAAAGSSRCPRARGRRRSRSTPSRC